MFYYDGAVYMAQITISISKVLGGSYFLSVVGDTGIYLWSEILKAVGEILDISDF